MKSCCNPYVFSANNSSLRQSTWPDRYLNDRTSIKMQGLSSCFICDLCLPLQSLIILVSVRLAKVIAEVLDFHFVPVSNFDPSEYRNSNFAYNFTEYRLSTFTILCHFKSRNLNFAPKYRENGAPFNHFLAVEIHILYGICRERILAPFPS
jgi:hypothetical protein